MLVREVHEINTYDHLIMPPLEEMCSKLAVDKGGADFTLTVGSKKATLCACLSFNASVSFSQKMWLTPFLNQYRSPLGDYSGCHELKAAGFL